MNINLKFKIWKLNMKFDYYHICENCPIWKSAWLIKKIDTQINYYKSNIPK